jgi:hypothetical protein
MPERRKYDNRGGRSRRGVLLPSFKIHRMEVCNSNLYKFGLGIYIVGIVAVETFDVSVFYRYCQKFLSDQPVFIKIIYL